MNEFVLENATYTPMSNGDTKPEAIKNPLARISYTHDTGDDLQDRGEYLEYSSYGFEPDIKALLTGVIENGYLCWFRG